VYLGLTLSCPLAGMALMRFAPKKVIIASLVGNAIAVFLFGAAQGIGMLFVARALIGFTQVRGGGATGDGFGPGLSFSQRQLAAGTRGLFSFMRRCGWMSSLRKGPKQSGCRFCRCGSAAPCALCGPGSTGIPHRHMLHLALCLVTFWEAC